MGITIGNKHSYSDYGLILSSKSVPAPSVKEEKVDITGGDGELDFTEAFGEPKFKNRDLSFVFSKAMNSGFEEYWSDLQNELQGQKKQIILDEDDDFYYLGRCSLSYSKSKNIYKITMKVDSDPYKMKMAQTVKTKTGSGTINLTNLRKRVVPTIVTTSQTTLVFGGNTFNLGDGTWVLPELELIGGNNNVAVTTSGTVTFTYREGGL